MPNAKNGSEDAGGKVKRGERERERGEESCRVCSKKSSGVV